MTTQKELLIENTLNNYFGIINDDILMEGIMDIPKEKVMRYLKDIKSKINKKDFNGLKSRAKSIAKRLPKISFENLKNKLENKNSKFKKLNNIAYNKLKSASKGKGNVSDGLLKKMGSLMAIKASKSKNPKQEIDKEITNLEKKVEKKGGVWRNAIIVMFIFGLISTIIVMLSTYPFSGYYLIGASLISGKAIIFIIIIAIIISISLMD